VFFHLLDKLKRLIAFGSHFDDAPLGLLQRILKLSDAIRLWFPLWHAIGFLRGEPSGHRRLFRQGFRDGKHMAEPARSVEG
jgi:hypothetical protein